MIKFTGANRKTGRRAIFLGLSRGNIDKLTAGHPVHLFLEEMGIPNTDAIIFFGETEESMRDDLLKAGWLTQEDIDKAYPIREKH